MPERLPPFLRRTPPPEALAWAARTAGKHARVIAIRRLRGGSASAVHALTVEDVRGVRRRLVLRRYVREDWLAEEPDVAEREARVLRALAATDIPAPEVLAYDEDGSQAGVPAVLMLRMPGRIDISGARLDASPDVIAGALARIHALPCATVPRLQPYRAWHDPAADAVPRWSRQPEAWRRLIEADQAELPALPPVLLHRDFHPGNLLWSRGRLSGITDWVNASCGPPGIDVGHCRVNLAWSLGIDSAERFREAYERASGRTYQPQFDARSILDGDMTSGINLSQAHDAGRSDLTPAAVGARLDEFVALVASRL